MRAFKICLYMILGLMCLVLTGYITYDTYNMVRELIVNEPYVYVEFNYGIWGFVLITITALFATSYTTIAMFKNAIKLIRSEE